MGLKYSDAYSEMQALIDFLSKDPDLASRLNNISKLKDDFAGLLTRAREESAYELRSRYPADEAERLTGISRRTIDRWAYKWKYRHGLPAMMRMKKADLAKAIDLSFSPHGE